MSIQFRCPACGNGIEVTDNRAGQPVECPRCTTAMMAPAASKTVPMPMEARVLHYSGTLDAPDAPNTAIAGIAFALSLAGLCLPPLALMGFGLGVLALILIGSHPKKFGGRNPALTAVFLPVAELLVLAIVLPLLQRTGELAPRTVCQANLAGIGKGMLTYASDGNQGWPIAAHWSERVATATGQVNYVGRMGSKRGVASQPAAGETMETDGPDGREISTTRNLWTLIRNGGAMPGFFICPRSEDQKNDEDTPQDYWDFGAGDVPTAGALQAAQNEKAYLQVSYGYQVPYGRLGRPSVNSNPKMPLAADKGPYGAAAEMQGKTSPPAHSSGLSVKSNRDDWRPWNSPNHGGIGDGEGQNVLFADGSAEWHYKPVVRISNDNIYTQWQQPGAAGGQVIFGKGPGRSAPNLTPQGDTDSLIYP